LAALSFKLAAKTVARVYAGSKPDGGIVRSIELLSSFTVARKHQGDNWFNGMCRCTSDHEVLDCSASQYCDQGTSPRDRSQASKAVNWLAVLTHYNHTLYRKFTECTANWPCKSRSRPFYLCYYL